MKAQYQDKQNRKSKDSLFRLSEDFILLGLTLGIIFSVVLCTKFMREFFIPHSPIFSIVDPFLIQLVSLLTVCIFIYLFCKKNGKGKLGAIIALLVFLLILPVTYYLLEKVILKPSFAFNRPVCDAEHALIAHAMNEKHDFEYIVEEIDSGDFRCISMQGIFSAIKQLHETKKEVSSQAIKNILRSEYGGSFIKEIESHFEKVHELWNRRIYMQSIPSYIHILKNARGYVEEGWFTQIFQDTPSEREALREYSCPSGFAIRQTLILLTSIFLLFQGYSTNKHFVKPFFKKSKNRIIFLLFNILCFFYIIVARVAAYRHTFYDIGVGILAGTFFFFFVLILLLRALKSNLAIVFLFSIPYFMLSSFYSQQAGLLLDLFIAIWIILLGFYLILLVSDSKKVQIFNGNIFHLGKKRK